MAGGLSPTTSTAVVQQGTVVGQRCLKASLKELVNEVTRLRFGSPAIVMIGSFVDFQVESCAPEPANVTMPIMF